jgi:hypothetical protein
VAITKLTGFVAEAEVLGRMVRVEFKEGVGLTIEGLTHHEAMEAIDRLANRSLSAVNPRAALLLGQPLETPKNPYPEARRDQPAAPATSEKTTGKQTTRSSEDRTPEPAREESPPWVEDTKEDAKVAASLKSVPEPGADNGEVPEKVAKSARFIEVLEWVIQSKGFKPAQVDEIVAAIEALKELPAVRRVRDIRDKVTSNLEAYAEAGAGDAA